MRHNLCQVVPASGISQHPDDLRLVAECRCFPQGFSRHEGPHQQQACADRENSPVETAAHRIPRVARMCHLLHLDFLLLLVETHRKAPSAGARPGEGKLTATKPSNRGRISGKYPAPGKFVTKRGRPEIPGALGGNRPGESKAGLRQVGEIPLYWGQARSSPSQPRPSEFLGSLPHSGNGAAGADPPMKRWLSSATASVS